MTNSKRQHGIGSLAPNEKIVGKPGGLVEPGVKQYGLFKKIKKAVKKVVKSPIGKAALIGGGLWGLGKLGGIPGTGGIGKNWWSKGMGLGKNLLLGKARGVGPGAVQGQRAGGIWNWIKGNPGKAALIGAGTAGTLLPFMGTDEDEEIIDDWSVTPSSIANIRKMARARDPSLAFLPPAESVMSGYYGSKDGGIVGLANGGQPAEAQAEQMLKMEYQKYRNQGGTMSYQQFKMAVLQQAQGQGPMAQGQQQAPQMAAYGGRMGYQGGELVEDASMVEETPAGMMEENVEEVTGEPTREQMEALAMEIFQLRLEELDEEQLMIVYQAAMEQQPREEMMEEEIEFNPQMAQGQMAQPQMAADGGRMGYLFGKKVGVAYANPNVARSGNFKDNVLNMFANKFSGKKIATPNSPVAQSNSFMGSVVPQAFKGQDANYQAYLASGSPLDYQTWKTSQGAAPIMAAEGGIMNLGGMEKDYRAEGGFVPIGGKEKADDVPARLSKNEFVFTADAVRNAGGGDIDAGAEVMENMMNNLEAGGQISEESQGGGEEMISEEEIIEEPDGAQEMYDQQQMLQSRMA